MVMLSIAIAFLLCKYFNTYTMNLKKLFFAFGIVFLGAVPVGAQTFPYQDRQLSSQERAEDLVSRLTLEEKARLMMDNSAAVERLGIKSYCWWNEALHGVARAGLATVFPQPIGMAASFNPDLLNRVYTTVSDEARAKYAYQASRGSRERYQGVTMWTPTVNIFRDPRWGRGIETYGEDPYLTSMMGLQVVKGLQGYKKGGYDKLHACAKHLAVHSGPEWNRHSFDIQNLPARDLYETYLPAFETLVKEGGVREVMCAYNRFEGSPCCGNNKLEVQILRNDWGYKGIIVADCGAVADFYNEGSHHVFPDAAQGSASAVRHGTDLDCGSSYKALVESVQKGYVSEKEIDVCVTRLMRDRFDIGEMDPLECNPWNNIPYSVVASDEHKAVANEMAHQCMTLLLNKNNTLPLPKNLKKIAVVGPNANDSVMMWGNYNGMPRHTITMLEGIKNIVSAITDVVYEQGSTCTDNELVFSVFNQCTSNGKKGFTAYYWNNLKQEGEPVATMQMTTPFQLCTSGATVFASGVNLTDFSAKYVGTLKPEKDGEIVIDSYVYGAGRVLVNGKELKKYSNTHGGRPLVCSFEAKAGKTYDIQLDFAYTRTDAQLNFDLGYKKNVSIESVVDKVKDAEVVIYIGGISPRLEGEEMGVNIPGFKRGDRTDIELPKIQRETLAALKKAGKKVVYVNCSGSPIGLIPEMETCDAILQAWYPGQEGGEAVADVLFGEYNPSGKLPVTFYKNVSQLPDFEDYRMQNRTYRYMKEEPLFPFGYGLSYTTFKIGAAKLSSSKIGKEDSLTVSFSVHNTGKMDGAEVCQIYLRKEGDETGPLKALRGFKRVELKAGEKKNVSITLGKKELEWWNEEVNSMTIVPGTYHLMLGNSSDSKALKTYKFTITK